jgi:competence protein ComFA
MDTHVYAVRVQSEWKWQVTLDVCTDIHYWFERFGGDAGILLLNPPFSLGQAHRVRQLLSPEMIQKYLPFLFSQGSPSLNSAHTQAALAAFAVQIRSMAADCSFNNRKTDNLSLLSISYEMWQEGAFPSLDLQQILYDQVVRALSGRALLAEEIQQLIELLGLDAASTEWRSYVQLAHLQGDAEITSGLMVQERREWRTFWKKSETYLCRRCGSGASHMFWSYCVHCEDECPYCEACLTMGRTRSCSLLVLGNAEGMQHGMLRDQQIAQKSWGTIGKQAVHIAHGKQRMSKAQDKRGQQAERQPVQDMQRSAFEEAYIAPWGLSTAQTAASLEGLRFMEQGSQSAGHGGGGGPLLREKRSPNKPLVSGGASNKFLIWAVTGAGKTEMIFPFIQYEIARGGKVLIATPRKDVVLELRPRIEKAFQGHTVVTLYGGSEQRWEQGDITIATTHQLIRFHAAFDLVIIDEIDAFPYHNNPMLEYAAQKVCKPSGNNILLSATPPSPVRRAVRRGQLAHVKVPVRFHRHPLPVPELVSSPPLHAIVKSGKIPEALLARLQKSLDRGAQLFVFVASIKLVEPMVDMLRHKLRFRAGNASDFHTARESGLNAADTAASARHTPSGGLPIEGTSSKDPLRSEKVLRFRDRDIRVLVTTTILERGVTIPKSDVFIIDADSQLFDDAALVQMSGRAGRSKDDPAGKVYFAAKEKTNSQSEAIKQIKSMNRLARQQGYFKGDNR